MKNSKLKLWKKQEEQKDNQTEIVEQATDIEQLYKPGEKGFVVALVVFGLCFFMESIRLYKFAPGADSYGAVPAFVSGLIVVLGVIIIIKDRKKATENTGQTLGVQIRRTWSYVMPKDIAIMVVFVLLYCMALLAGIGFVIVTPIFLFVSMGYLRRKEYLRNFMWTALCMGFIILVFSIVFHVELP